MQEFGKELAAAGLTAKEVKQWQTDAAGSQFHQTVGRYSLADVHAMVRRLEIRPSKVRSPPGPSLRSAAAFGSWDSEHEPSDE